MIRILVPLAVATLALSVQAQTSTQSNGATQKVKSSRALRSEEVGDLLNATNEARIAIESRNNQDALFHVDHALENAARLESDTKSSRFVPLYQELDRYTVLAPIMTEKNRTSNPSTGSQGSNTTAKATQTPTTAIQQVTGEFTSVGLDIQAAKEHLEAAKLAIQQKHFTKADEALAAVQDGVVVTKCSV